MKTARRPAKQKAVIAPSQSARTGRTLRLQVALDEAAKAERAGRIRQLREESPYTQPALADKVGVTLRAYQRWEEGGGIEWEHLEKLAEIHDVDVQWIHRGREQGPAPDPFATSRSPSEQFGLVLQNQAEILARIIRIEASLGITDELPDVEEVAAEVVEAAQAALAGVDRTAPRPSGKPGRRQAASRGPKPRA